MFFKNLLCKKFCKTPWKITSMQPVTLLKEKRRLSYFPEKSTECFWKEFCRTPQRKYCGNTITTTTILFQRINFLLDSLSLSLSFSVSLSLNIWFLFGLTQCNENFSRFWGYLLCLICHNFFRDLICIPEHCW